MLDAVRKHAQDISEFSEVALGALERRYFVKRAELAASVAPADR
jgi:hypothetical protein